MKFEEWFEKWWGERTDGPYKSVNVESIARAAWEAALTHDPAKAHAEPVAFAQVLENGDLRISANGLRVLSKKLDKSRVMQPLYLQPEPEVALLNNAVSAQPTLRDQFAIAALPECASEHRYKNDNGETVAREAYMFADAMLKEREK